jgi:hypothetical protein
MRLVPALHRSSCFASVVFLTQPCSQLLLFLVVAAFGTGLAGGSWLRKIKKHYQPPPSPIAAPLSATLRLDGHGFRSPPASRSHLRHQFRNGRPGGGWSLKNVRRRRRRGEASFSLTLLDLDEDKVTGERDGRRHRACSRGRGRLCRVWWRGRGRDLRAWWRGHAIVCGGRRFLTWSFIRSPPLGLRGWLPDMDL